MDEVRERQVCPVCGRPTVRTVFSYTLGRKDSMPYRRWTQWRHDDDGTLACEVADA